MHAELTHVDGIVDLVVHHLVQLPRRKYPAGKLAQFGGI